MIQIILLSEDQLIYDWFQIRNHASLLFYFITIFIITRTDNNIPSQK